MLTFKNSVFKKLESQADRPDVTGWQAGRIERDKQELRPRLITNPAKIDEVMRRYMSSRGSQPMPFLVVIAIKAGEIWNSWKVTPGGLEVEGSCPISCSEECHTGERTYTLSNGDSGYMCGIGSVRLSGIAYIQIQN